MGLRRIRRPLMCKRLKGGPQAAQKCPRSGNVGPRLGSLSRGASGHSRRPPWRPLEAQRAPWAVSVGSGSVLESLLAILGTSWGTLGSFWGPFGASVARRRAVFLHSGFTLWLSEALRRRGKQKSARTKHHSNAFVPLGDSGGARPLSGARWSLFSEHLGTPFGRFGGLSRP